jgi:predicted amidohydrolase YtcJ
MKYGFHPNWILHGGLIHTLDDELPQVESIAIHADRIIAVGKSDEVESLAGADTKIVHLEDRTVLPGLVDGHIHLEKYVLNMEKIDCEVPSLDECLDIVRQQAEITPPGEWIQGHGWNQNEWHRYGNTGDLDAITKDHKVYLTAKSLHAAWVNTPALAAAGINRDTLYQGRGQIAKDTDGEPTGIVYEDAMKLVSEIIPAPSPVVLAQKIQNAQERLWKFGITGLHDFDSSSCLGALQILRDQELLGLRILKSIPVKDFESALELGVQTNFGDVWLRFGGVKLYADGALGTCTASMLAPYGEDPENVGMLLLEEDELLELSKRAVLGGLSLAIHSIGDRANRQVLDVFEALRHFESEHGLPHLRHRIEHAQLLHPDDIPRFSKLGITASMQPYHAPSDMHMADKHWGERVRHAYAWRSLLEAGTSLVFGSDSPVEAPNPFSGLHAAITRQRLDGSPGENGWVPEERLDLHDALRCYTLTPAETAGMQMETGRIRENFLADLIVLDQDLYQCEPSEIAKIVPVGTMVGGIWRHRSF